MQHTCTLPEIHGASVTQRRDKRVAKGLRKLYRPQPSNGERVNVIRSNQTTPSKGPEVGEDDFSDYPDGYFIQPGVTDIPETYDYNDSKFKKPHLTMSEWKAENTNRTRHYKVERSRLKSIAPMKDIKPPSVVGGLLGDDLL